MAVGAFLCAPFFNGREDLGDDLAPRLRAEVSLTMNPEADSARFQVTFSDHEHSMDLLLLGALDLSVDLICRQIKLRADPVGAKFGVDAPGEIHQRLLGADREDTNLLRREPKGEITGIMLDKKPDESLVGAERRAMDAERSFLHIIAILVHQPESF